jgi:hypothetical protein
VRHYVRLLLAEHLLDEGELPMMPNEALLASIATNHLLLRHAAICKHEL